jgi:3-oxoacyl-[acyl-carrier protein] reductase
MDLGLVGRTAVVCASSQGLGLACATELARAGCTVVVNGRDSAKLEHTAEQIRQETGASVVPVAADLDTAEGQDRLVAAAPTVDILVNNNGGPPPREYHQVDEAALFAGVRSNMATPIRLVQLVIDGMVERRFGRIVNVTSASVKMPLPGLDLSSGARAGLTGFLAGVARTVVHANVTINFLLPGSFDTPRLRAVQRGAAERQGIEVDVVEKHALASIPAGRLGTPSEFGAACAFLCSANAGFITGQSLLIDGGAFPGIL